MADYLASLADRGIISPRAMSSLLQKVSYRGAPGNKSPFDAITAGDTGRGFGIGGASGRATVAPDYGGTPEKITGAAFLHNGKIYSGPNHTMALDQARNAGVSGTDVIKNGKEGFVTDSGRFVDRKEAVDIANAADQWRGPFKPSDEEMQYARERGITREALKPLRGE